jgi:hypothetical protein
VAGPKPDSVAGGVSVAVPLNRHGTPSPAAFAQMRGAYLDSGTPAPWLRNRGAVSVLGVFSLWRFFQIAVLGASCQHP